MTGAARLVALVALVALLLGAPASAVITRVYPLADMTADADWIVFGRIQDVRPDSLTLRPISALKGRSPGVSLTVRLSATDDHAQLPAIRARWIRGAEFMLYGKAAKYGLGFSGGAWLRIAPGPRRGGWVLVHGEPYLRRSYRGAVSELIRVTRAILSGKPGPKPDPKAPPGLGP